MKSYLVVYDIYNTQTQQHTLENEILRMDADTPKWDIIDLFKSRHEQSNGKYKYCIVNIIVLE